MKINLIDYIKKAGDTTSLLAVEQEKLETVLKEYMAMKPIREAEGMAKAVSSGSEARPTGVRGAILSPLSFIHLKKNFMPIALILGLLLSGTASYAAEGSVPGDLLYPVKVGINEKAESALAFSAESKAALEAKFAERRLSEAANLAVKSKLNADASAKLSNDFAVHADGAVAQTQEVHKKDSSVAIGLASDFESKLAAHEMLLAEVGSNGNTNDLRALVRAKGLLISKFRMDAEGDAEVSARSNESVAVRKAAAISGDIKANAGVKEGTAIMMGKAAAAAIKDAQSVFARVSSRLDTATAANVKAQIDAAAALSAKGDASLKRGDFANAFHAYQDALVVVKKLSVYLNASSDLKIKISAPASASSGQGGGSIEESDDPANVPESKRILQVDVEADAEADAGTNNVNVGGSGSGSVNIGL